MIPPSTVYRYYTEDGVLLYVGCTFDHGRRLQQHKITKEWWYEIKYIRLDHYAERWEAMRAESIAITIEKPRHNLIATPGARRTKIYPPKRDRVAKKL
jgi:hypothetical protein